MRRDRGIAPRSSALLHIQHLLHPSLLRPGILTLHVQVRRYFFYQIIHSKCFVLEWITFLSFLSKLFFANTFF